MSLRDFVEPECSGANSLMRLGSAILQNGAFKDAGFRAGTSSSSFGNQSLQIGSDEMVHEFLGQLADPPQTFRMDALLREMHEMDSQSFHIQAPSAIDLVNSGADWANEFSTVGRPYQPNVNSFTIIESNKLNEVWKQGISAPFEMTETFQIKSWDQEFFDTNDSLQQRNIADRRLSMENFALNTSSLIPEDSDQFKYSDFMKFMQNVDDAQIGIDNAIKETSNDWIEDFDRLNKTQDESTESYNTQFWNQFQDEWMKISSEAGQHPWTSELADYQDPYKEYTFNEENPMTDMENAFEKGKFFLANGDIPSAVLCFESAVKQDSNNAEIWELLGTSQAENEKDPNAIAALKRSLELNPNNPKVMMSLAVSYTNESLQNQALNMLVNWLKFTEIYKNLIPPAMASSNDESLTTSIANGIGVTEVQDLFLKAVQRKHPEIDPDIQEALGVLFNLSSEFDKAVDCFKAALVVRSDNAKTWNRLGASLANGNRPIEAVDAYQRSLAIQPGFIRARYNVGIICINLKAYNEAAEHFLTALNMQADSLTRSGLHQIKSTNQMSDSIWGTLRMVVSLMGQTNLLSSVDERNLTSLNEAFNLNG